jgi:predicted aldo/keto reductase-like oxidoreductase
VQYAFNQMEKERTPVAWALHWLWDQPEVTTILSGMTTMDHVKENVALANEAEIGSFTQEEHDLMARARDEFNKKAMIPCTNCQYCLPCTVDLQIPEILGVFNHAVMYDALDETRGWYNSWDAEKMASACIDCDACEPKCPQNIPISDWMVKVAAVMENGASIESI